MCDFMCTEVCLRTASTPKYAMFCRILFNCFALNVCLNSILNVLLLGGAFERLLR